MPTIRRFPTGKVPPKLLKQIVFNSLGVPSDRVIQGPGVGEDAAIIDMDNSVLAVKADPITGAIGNIGWLVVHINANDIASCGVCPLWFMCVVLLPEGADETALKGIMKDVHEACCEIGVTLVSGHTEITPGLERPILVGCMAGEAPKDGYVTTGGAKPGDTIILTKTAGIEGTAILANDLYDVLRGSIDASTLDNAKSLLRRISVVAEAMKAMEIGGVHSLHDPTEGGILNGVWEMAEASKTGVQIEEKDISIAPETIAISRALDIDPLKLLGSGALLIVCEASKSVEICSALHEMSIEASVIGHAKPRNKGRFIIRRDGRRSRIEAVEQDHLYKVLEKYGIKE